MKTYSFQKKIISSVRKIIKENKASGEINIILIDDKDMRGLNRKYRKKDKATDVLSFDINENGVLGEIYISLPTAKKQAKVYNVSLEEELTRLAVHGTLHILGYTHKEMGACGLN